MEKEKEKILFWFEQKSIGLPDIHSGYGFAIGNMAAFDTADPSAVVSPGTYTVFSLLSPSVRSLRMCLCLL